MHVFGTQMVPTSAHSTSVPYCAQEFNIPQPLSLLHLPFLWLNILPPTTPSWTNFLISPNKAPWPSGAYGSSRCPTHADPIDCSQDVFGNDSSLGEKTARSACDTCFLWHLHSPQIFTNAWMGSVQFCWDFSEVGFLKVLNILVFSLLLFKQKHAPTNISRLVS